MHLAICGVGDCFAFNNKVKRNATVYPTTGVTTRDMQCLFVTVHAVRRARRQRCVRPQALWRRDGVSCGAGTARGHNPACRWSQEPPTPELRHQQRRTLVGSECRQVLHEWKGRILTGGGWTPTAGETAPRLVVNTGCCATRLEFTWQIALTTRYCMHPIR